jgi:hypothetical protein
MLAMHEERHPARFAGGLQRAAGSTEAAQRPARAAATPWRATCQKVACCNAGRRLHAITVHVHAWGEHWQWHMTGRPYPAAIVVQVKVEVA